MIVKIIDHGWGAEHKLRQVEQSIIEQYLSVEFEDSSRTVIVNNTWYPVNEHARILAEIKKVGASQVVLVAMMDPPNLDGSWFFELGCKVRQVGYFPGPDEIDAWAVIVSENFRVDSRDIDTRCLDIPFICLNRKPHWHRRRLFSRLLSNRLDQSGIVTMGDSSGTAIKTLPYDVMGSDLAPNPGPAQYGIANDIMSLGPSNVWNRCFLNLVTETVYDVDSIWFVSEKIYKPILGLRPFLVYAPNAAENWLAHCGILSYTKDFDDISDLDLNDPSNHVDFLNTLASQSRSYFQYKYTRLLPKIYYNRWQFERWVSTQRYKIQQGRT